MESGCPAAREYEVARGKMGEERHALRMANDKTRLAGQVGWGFCVNGDGIVQKNENEEQVVVGARHMRGSGSTIREIVGFLRKLGVGGRRRAPIGPTPGFE